MRFLPVETDGQQAGAMIFRTRDLLVRQRTRLINPLRSHPPECGVVAVQCVVHVERLQETIEPSVGSVGDSYSNALAETINGLYKTE